LLAEASDQPRSRQQHDGEAWIDEGPVDPVLRHAAVAATHRAAKRRSRLEPGTEAELVAVLGERDARELAPQLSAAADALDRDRLEDARRLMAPLLRQFPDVAAVQETAGLVSYRLGRWKQAARQLERAQELHTNAESLPVLGDCYRALGRHTAVERTWKQLKNASPRHETMTEGRIVMAGSLADRGDLKAAIELLDPGAKRPKRIRDHHLRQWYALADLYDRAGDPVRARHWFTVVANQDAEFVDVLARLGSLGR
jgi:tetratricopeptide (TPR) repeat protein